MFLNNRIESRENESRDASGALAIDNAEGWIKLAREIPWKLFEDQYAVYFSSILTNGTSSQRVRMLLGALIIQIVYALSSEETIVLLQNNPYLQYFIGREEFSNELPFDSTMLTECKRYVTDTTLKEIMEFITQVAPECIDSQRLLNKSGFGSNPPAKMNNVNDRSTRVGSPEETDDKEDVPEPAAESLEHTLQMPALVEEPSENKIPGNSHYRSVSCLKNYLRRLQSFFSNLSLAGIKAIRNSNQNIRQLLAESYEPRPELKAGWATVKKGFTVLGAHLSQIILRLRCFNKVWLKIILAVLAVLLISFVAILIWLPVPAPRMLVASEVYDSHHKLAATFFSENRRPVSLKDVPPFLRNAVLAVEDHRFYKHKGINPGRIIKAAVNDMLHGSLEQGGSTITQQLVKNVYLTPERTFSRKFQELLYSIKLEYKLSKDQIFELYLNKIYFGHGAYGVRVAAETYFQKELNQLNQAEMALLAGLPRGPAYYSPYNHPQAARQRLIQTLQRMKECGYITTSDFSKYCQQSLNLPGIRTRNNVAAPYFMDMLQDELTRIFPDKPELLYTSGLKIESTLDLEMQKDASKAFHNGLPVIFRPHGTEGLPQPQGALIAIDPRNGEVRALIGGTDYQKSQFNRAVQAKRQPGSAFKPILYTAAFKNGYTLASQISREPKTYYIGGQPYCPTDHHNGEGTISMRKALAQSSNVVAVKLMERIGFTPVFDLAKKLGIKSKLRPTLSLALGACEVTPLELATAYATLANGGNYNKPTTIRRILNSQGRVLYEAKPQTVNVIDPAFPYLTTQAMSEVLRSGTAAGIGRKLGRPAAGKTGTTNNNRDTWFVGYTPDLLACVFVGCDNYERTLPGMASQVAAPIWADFMINALKKEPVKDFKVPANIKRVSICRDTGKLSNEACSNYLEYFLKGTEPNEYCSGHHFFSIIRDHLSFEKHEESFKSKSESTGGVQSQSKIENRESEKTENTENDRILRRMFQKIWNRIK